MLVYLAGVDGAGKTTLAQRLVQHLRGEGYDARYQYLQYYALLLLPARWLARRVLLSGQDEVGDDATYGSSKRDVSGRHTVLARAYRSTWTFDYLLQTLPRTARWPRRGVVLIDRYYADQVVNMKVTFASIDCAAILSRFERVLPPPDVTLFLRIKPAVALSRKSGIQGSVYLTERAAIYEELAAQGGWSQLDADRPADQVARRALEIVRRVLESGATGVDE